MEEKITTIDYALRSTWHNVIKMYNEQAKKYGGSMAEGFTLLSINPDEGSPSTSLGPRMGVEATSLSRILKSMEEKKLIFRKANPNDGRGVLIFLTEEGAKKRDIAKERVIKFNDVIKSNISQEKIEAFYEVTETINSLICENKVFKK